jgi:hypothetical protein
MIVVVEKKWTTVHGYLAEVLLLDDDHLRTSCLKKFIEPSWRCGYVAVPLDHPLFGLEYSEPHPSLSILINENTRIGDRGIIPVFLHAMNPDPDKEIRIDCAFDVHGSLTFSGSRDTDEWWFGFDCHHGGDTPKKCTLEYCIEQCEFLAAQLKDVADYDASL